MCESGAEGLVLLPGSLRPELKERLAIPLVFERQRLPEARCFALAPMDELAADLAAHSAGPLRRADAAWTLQSYAASPDSPSALHAWARRMEEALRASLLALAPALGKHFREHAAALPPARGRVLQLCAVPGGVWLALNAPNELSNVNPGGVPHLAADPQAPSRSYLKIEEALQAIGTAPAPRQRVIDLGAAPGGWSYAFLKRGCRVLAVDNGPMKLKGLEALAGELTHVRANGLSFHPPRGWAPVDWMVSDMLVPPGPTMGLLRRWLQAGWAGRYVVNIKLPQRQPLAVLQPLQEMLAGQQGLSWQLRQLFHDRREVTLMAQAKSASSSASPAPSSSTKKKRAGRGTRRGVSHRGVVHRRGSRS